MTVIYHTFNVWGNALTQNSTVLVAFRTLYTDMQSWPSLRFMFVLVSSLFFFIWFPAAD